LVVDGPHQAAQGFAESKTCLDIADEQDPRLDEVVFQRRYRENVLKIVCPAQEAGGVERERSGGVIQDRADRANAADILLGGAVPVPCPHDVSGYTRRRVTAGKRWRHSCIPVSGSSGGCLNPRAYG